MKTCHSKVHGGSPLQVWAVSAKFLPDEARSKFSILQPEPLCKNWWRDLSTFVIGARHQIWLTSIRGVPAWAAVRKSQRWHRNWWKTGNSCVALMVQAIEPSCWKMISGWYKEVHHEWWRACCPEAWSGQWARSSKEGTPERLFVTIQPVGESTSDRYVRLLRKGCTSEMQAQL